MYSTAQFKLDRTRMQHGLDTTCFSFHVRASIHMHTRLMTSNLPFKALVLRTRRVQDSLQMHACMSGMYTPNLDYVCMQIVSQGQQNKLYKHVHVLRCNLPRDTRCKSC